MCGVPRRWTSSARSREYLWLVAAWIDSTASRHRPIASPEGPLVGIATCELIRSKSFIRCGKKWKFYGVKHDNFACQSISNSRVTLRAISRRGAMKSSRRDQPHSPWALRCRRVCPWSLKPLRCLRPRLPTRSRAPKPIQLRLIEREWLWLGQMRMEIQ